MGRNGDLDSDGITNDYAELDGAGTQTISSGGVLETEGSGTTASRARFLRANIDVDGGSLDLAAADNVMDSGNAANTITITAGNMTVEGTAELSVTGNSSIDAEGGTLTDDGSFVVNGNAATTFTDTRRTPRAARNPSFSSAGAAWCSLGRAKESGISSTAPR